MGRKVLLIILSFCLAFVITACELPSFGGNKVDPGWIYEEVDGGIMITGYTGDAESLTLPGEIKGKEVVCVKAGNNYSFTEINIYPYNCLYMGEDGSFYLNSNGGDRVIQLGGSLTARVGFNMVFGVDQLKVGNLECDVNYKDFGPDDFTNVPWELIGSEHHPYSINLVFSTDNKVVMTDHGTEEKTEGTYSYSEGIISVTLGGETTELMLLGDDLVCWEADNYFSKIMDEPYLTVFSLPDYNRDFLSFANSENYWTNAFESGTSGGGACTIKFGESNGSASAPGENISMVVPTLNISHDGTDSTLFPAGTYEYKVMGNRIVFGENNMYSLRILEGYILQDGHNNVFVMVYPD